MKSPTSRTELLTARFSVNEEQRIREFTETRGISISGFIRDAVLNQLMVEKILKADNEAE